MSPSEMRSFAEFQALAERSPAWILDAIILRFAKLHQTEQSKDVVEIGILFGVLKGHLGGLQPKELQQLASLTGKQ